MEGWWFKSGKGKGRGGAPAALWIFYVQTSRVDRYATLIATLNRCEWIEKCETMLYIEETRVGDDTNQRQQLSLRPWRLA